VVSHPARRGERLEQPHVDPGRILPHRWGYSGRSHHQPPNQQEQRDLDDVWAWRADHGAGVGWTSNTAAHGLIVNGDNVTAYGLFVEHYQRYEVIWNGENGRTIMFQNEMPYDPPNQDAWSHDGIDGFASYKVADHVRSHQGWGLGSYCFFNVNPSIVNAHAFEVPNLPAVQFHDLVTVSLGGVGTIDRVINDTGGTANTSNQVVYLLSYP
jgi:hypothetical protein